MKVVFDTTLADGPDFQHLHFIAETGFERRWLKAWAKKREQVKHIYELEWTYPNHEPKDLNNPTLTLRIKETDS